MSNIKLDRVGKTKIQRCGVSATIIEYFSSDNITVKFGNIYDPTNNAIAYNKRYIDFDKGKLIPYN